MEHISMFFTALGGRTLSHDKPNLTLWRSLVIHGDVAEQVGHGLSVVDAAYGLSQYHADIHSFYFGTLQLLYFMGHGVGHHHLRVNQKEDVDMTWFPLEWTRIIPLGWCFRTLVRS